MTTRDTIQAYFDALMEKKDWKSFLAENMAFASFGTPAKQLVGRDAYVESTKRFYSIIQRLEVRDILVDGDRACVLTRYDLQPPGGAAALGTGADRSRRRYSMPRWSPACCAEFRSSGHQFGA